MDRPTFRKRVGGLEAIGCKRCNRTVEELQAKLVAHDTADVNSAGDIVMVSAVVNE